MHLSGPSQLYGDVGIFIIPISQARNLEQKKGSSLVKSVRPGESSQLLSAGNVFLLLEKFTII